MDNESNVQKIIRAHSNLISEYNSMLRSTDEGGFIFIRGTYKNKQYNMLDLYRLLRRSDVSFLDKVMIMIIQVFDPAGAGTPFNIFPWISFSFLFKLIGTLLKNPSRLSISRLFTTSEEELVTRDPRVIRSFVKYLIKIHIKRQYAAIYRLYLSEILRQNGIGNSQERYSTLRDIASDLKNYLDTLPSVKSIFASMVAVFSIFATAVGLLNLGSLIFEYIVNQPSYVFLIVIPVSIAIGYIVTVPFIYSFWFKRHLFLRTGNWYYLNDVYFGNERQLYDNSIYKLEDDLFGALGARYEKLNEVPFDKILPYQRVRG
ncbi:MAG: hypothetical protein ACM3X1_03320 [Ignavibacteriales bacterium]